MKRAIILLSAILFLAGCGGGGSSNNPTPTPKPTAATLGAPAQNEVCTTGTIISSTQSTIAFSWIAGLNVSSYNLVIKNLLTKDSTTQTTSQTQATATLQRNTPYSWYVVSESSTNATAQSPVWKFYNSGPGVVSYAPFPAEITSPTFAESVTTSTDTVNLTWTGSAVLSNSIANYDVYFGTTTTPSLLKSQVTDSFLNGVAVSSKTTYYWKVITRDILGDTSDSGLYQFTVN